MIMYFDSNYDYDYLHVDVCTYFFLRKFQFFFFTYNIIMINYRFVISYHDFLGKRTKK